MYSLTGRLPYLSEKEPHTLEPISIPTKTICSTIQ